MKNYFLLLSLALCCVACTVNEQDDAISKIESEQNNQVLEQNNKTTKFSTVTHIDTLGLKVLYPNFTKVDLVCGTMPSKDDDSVLLVMAAAYTGQCLKEFKHSNIAGNHVSGGVLYDGYRCTRNTGAFVYYNNAWKFCYKNYASELRNAANNGGAAFAQEMIIYNDTIRETVRPNNGKPNVFRALCEHNGKLCVIETTMSISFGDFKKILKNYGVKHAIYTDMGNGWNYAWYRSDGKLVILQPYKHPYCTNWVTFYK